MGLVRVTLALAVLLSHLPMLEFKILNGALAVQSFFIISGFYMALVLDGKYRDAGLFYSNRLLRLFPTYFAMCAISALAVFGLNASATGSPEIFATIFSNPLSALIMAFENLFLLGQELLFWFTINPDGSFALNTGGVVPDESTTLAWQGLFVPQSWSLSMELMFYALAPWLMRAGWKWIAALAALSIGLRLAGAFLPVDYLLWQGRFFPTALFLFLAGMLAYKASPVAARLPKAVGWGANALLLGFLIFHPMLQDALHIEPVRGRWVVYLVVAAAIPFVFNAFKDLAWDRWIGDLSYPIYLSQIVTIGLVLTYNPPFAAIIAIGATLALSALTLVVIEHPLDRWRQRRAATAATTNAAALGAAAAVRP